MSSALAASQGGAPARCAHTDWSISSQRERPQGHHRRGGRRDAACRSRWCATPRRAATIMVDGAARQPAVSARLHVEAERHPRPGARVHLASTATRADRARLTSCASGHSSSAATTTASACACAATRRRRTRRRAQDLPRLGGRDRDPPLEFAAHLDVDVVALKEVIKKARKWHAEMMKIRIGLRQQGRARSRWSPSPSRDADREQRPPARARGGDGSLVVRAASDGSDARAGAGDDLEPHEGSFLVDRTDSFVRSAAHGLVQRDARDAPRSPTRSAATRAPRTSATSSRPSTTRVTIQPVRRSMSRWHEGSEAAATAR